MNNRLKQFSLLLGDITILFLSLYITLLVRYFSLPTTRIWQMHLTPFAVIFGIWILIFYIANLYNLSKAINNAKFFQLTAKSIATAGAISIAFFYLTPEKTVIAPKTNLLIFILIFFVFFLLWRSFFNYLISSYLPQKNICIIGINNQVIEIIQELKQKPFGYKVAFIMAEDAFENIPAYNDITQLRRLIQKKDISEIILTDDYGDSAILRSTLFECLSLGVNYISLPDFYEKITGKIPIEAINQTWFLEKLSEGDKKTFKNIKRFYDIILAIIIFVVSLPFWLIAAICIKLESRGPIFFKQTRLGKNGKEFEIIKFRTMKTIGNDFAPTEKNDSRVTKVGSFLRKSRIDEIPQVINIFKGEMSFVGPRPERPELVENLEKNVPFYRERMLVKPGVTGWDQISGEYHSPSLEDTFKKLQNDLYYIKNRSIYLDLSIMLKTIATVLSRAGR